MRKKILDHFEKVDKKLFKAADTEVKKFLLDGAKKTSNEYFVSLCKSIVSQQLSGKAARSIYLRFEALFPKKKVNPKKLIKFTEHQLRAVGMSYGKARALLSVAEHVLNKKVSFLNIHTRDENEIREMLIQIYGVGPWTIEMFLMFSIGREDIFSTKDLGLQKGIQKIYNLKDRPDERKMERLSKKWSPYRTYASIILWNCVDNQ